MSTQGQDGERNYPCRIEDGRFVLPCASLASVFDGNSSGRGRALYLEHLTNIKTLKPSRSFVVMRMGEHAKKGIILNCCPFCGERIDAPVLDATPTSNGGDHG